MVMYLSCSMSRKGKEMANAIPVDVPPSYRSRLSTIEEAILTLVDEVYDFIVLRNAAPSERQTLLVPKHCAHVPVSKLIGTEDADEMTIPIFRRDDDEFLALKLCSDVLSRRVFTGVNVNQEAEIASVPNSVHMFLNLLLGDQSHFDACEEFDANELDGIRKERVLSIGQDIVYGVCGNKNSPPKHVGLGLTLHNAKRSIKLVNLFNKAGHIASYGRILSIDTGMAESTLKSIDNNTGAVVPLNLILGRFVHFQVDNIDINNSSLDGKNTFHATQMAVWQRGPPEESILDNVKPSDKVTLDIPHVLEKICEVVRTKETATPDFSGVKTHCLMACGGSIPKLLIISLDGFRSDYLDSPGMTNFSELMKWTFVPHMRPVFPSKTFPNHVSMATGLFSDQHGVIGPFFNASGALIDVDSTEYWNYSPHVTPIWAANEEEGGGRFSGCMMWPGCSYIKTPTYNQPFNMSLSWEERVGTVISWLRRTEQPANLVLWYLEQPDLLAHAFGPGSPEVADALRRVDDLLGYVIKSLRLFDLLESVNLVVTSDHGMVAVPSDHLINLDTVVDPGQYTALGPNPVLRIVTSPARTLPVFDRLRDGSEKLRLHYSVYVREKIPARWHYGTNRRVSDILLVADEGYLFRDRDFNDTLLKYQRLGYNTTGSFGNHGYDPALVSMHHPLLARGPAFRRALVHSSAAAPLENVDMYPLAAAVLQLVAASQRHNGSLDRVLPLLVEALHPPAPEAEDGAPYFWSSGRSPSTAGFWATVTMLAVVGFTLVCATYQCLKRRRLGRLVNDGSIVKGYDFRYTPVHNRVHQSCSVDEALKPVALHAVDDDSDEIEYLLPDAVTANQQA